MNNPGIIDTFLNVYTTAINSGFGAIQPNVLSLASILIIIDIVLAALFWALGEGEEIIVGLIRKTLYIGFFVLLISNWQSYMPIIFQSFSGLGLHATGDKVTAAQFMQPGKIAQTGLDAASQIGEAIKQFPSLLDPSTWGTVFVLAIAWLIVVLSFFVLAVQLFVVIVEWKLVTLAGFILVPFGLFGKTAFITERVLGYVVTSGIKVMVLAMVVGIGVGLFQQFPSQSSSGTPSAVTAPAGSCPTGTKQLGSTGSFGQPGTLTGSLGFTPPTVTCVVGWDQAFVIALAALTLLGLGLNVPALAAGLASGAPQLGAGAAAGVANAAMAPALVAGGAVRTGATVAAPVARWTWSGLFPNGAGGAGGGGAGGGGAGGGGPGGGGPGGGGAGGGGGAPAWFQEWRRRNAAAGTRSMASGASRMGRAIQSGDRGGPTTSVSLR